MAAISVPKTLDDLSDVAATSPSTGQVLGWNGAAWAPASAGAQGPKGDPGVQGPPGTSGTRLDVTTFAGVAAAVAANQPVDGLVQTGFDGTTGAVDLYFPAGVYKWGDQLYLDRLGCGVSGAGRGVTTLQTVNGKTPILVTGLRRTETPGGTPQVVGAAHRPDAYGILDGAIAASPGNWKGFRTLGGTAQQCYGMAVDGPPVAGVIGPTGGRDFDGYGSVDALSIQIALGVVHGLSDLGTGSHTILSLGGVGQCTWLFARDAGGLWYVEFTTADGTTRSYRATPSGTAAGLHEVRVWVNLAAGTYGIAQNGSPLTPVSQVNMTGFAGMKLRRNEAYKVFIGPSHGSTTGEENAAVPDYTIWGFNVTATAVTAEPADDRARYVASDADSIFALDGSRAALSRTLQLATGNNRTATRRHCGFIIPCNGSDGGITGNFVRDLTLDGGGLVIGQNLDLTVSNVAAGNTTIGLAQVPFQVAYPVTLENCNFGGYFFAILATLLTPVRLRNVDVGAGGTTGAVLFLDCDVSWDGGMGQFFHSTGQEYWVKCAAAAGIGGSHSIKNLFPSSEAGFFTVGCLVIEANGAGGGNVAVENIKAGQVGATAAMVVLTENALSAPNQCTVGGLRWYDATGTSQAVRVSPKWAGTIDLRNNQIQRVGGTPGPDLTIRTN